jgi:type II secretory pathway pseudopilin PulG
MKQRGQTLIELLIVSTLSVVALLSFAQLLSFILRAEKITSLMVSSHLEHVAMRSFAATVTSASLSALVCGAPHPYMKMNSATGRCEAGVDHNGVPYPPPTSTQIDNWNALGDAVYKWVSDVGFSGGRLSQTLPASVFNATIVPLLQLNQCHTCHNGSGAAPVMDRAILSYTDWFTAPALVSSIPFATRMGQTLIRPEVQLSSMLSENTSRHIVRFFVPQTCEGSDIVLRTLTTNTEPTCPGPSTLCTYPDASSCSKRCTASTAGDSSTAPKCTTWQLTVNCYIPRLPCSVTPTCTAPTALVVGSCKENQPSVTCGPASTTWRCEDPMNPGVPFPAQYSVSTYYTSPTDGETHEYRSGGSLK